MNPRLLEFLTGKMGQSAARSRAFVNTLDPATAARLMAAAEQGDTRAILKAMAEQTWSTAPARAVPEPAAPSGSRSPMSFEDRVANDPEIRRSIQAAGGEVPTGAQAIMDAYRGTFAPGKRGRPKKAEDAIRELAKPADQVAAESIAGQFDRTVAPPARQATLPFDDEPNVNMMGMDESSPVGWNDPAVASVPTRQMELPLVRQDGGASPVRVADDMTFDEVPPRPATPKPEPRKFPARTAAAVAGGAAGVGMMLAGRDADKPAVTSGGEADLAAESRPAPKVSATAETPSPTVAKAPVDYSLKAREMINQLNAMRRAAGGEVPQAQAMMQEINRLIAMGNEQRKAPGYSYPKADPARDPYQQARALLAQVNALQARGYPHGSPEVQRLMQQVRQLQAQGDAIRNRRVG